MERLRAEMVDHSAPSCPLKAPEYCSKESCAWWNHVGEECSVATLGTLATIDIGGRER